MIGRVVVVLTVIALLVSLLIVGGLPHPVSAQDPLPTPVGRLGGREPLPTAEGPLDVPRPQNTPERTHHALVGAWLVTFAEPDQAPAQVVFGDDGLVRFIDAVGNQGAGVWMPSGQQSGVMAVVVEAADASGRPAQITILQGTIDVGTPGDAATLLYTMETVDGAGTTTEKSGPFTGRGQRVDEQLIVPRSE